jgi:two-component sensor histidine kinase
MPTRAFLTRATLPFLIGALLLFALTAWSAERGVRLCAACGSLILGAVATTRLQQIAPRRDLEADLGSEQLHRAKLAADAANTVLVERQRLLLREMNHRIANSLAMTQSLLRLQQREIQDPVVRNQLVQAQERVTAIAQVHRYLYAHDDFESVPVEEYLPRLLRDLAEALDRGTGEWLTVQVDPLRLPPDTVIQLGLLTAELVTNALKYAYPNGGGEIRVTLRVADELVTLTVEDDGVGFREGEPACGTGLGTRLIRAFSTALGGELSTMTGSGGTRVTMMFENTAKFAVTHAA